MDSRVQDYFDSAVERTANVVDDQPLSSAAVAFGVGVVAGIVAVALLSQQPSESRLAMAERHASDFGKQILDRLSGMAPASWKR